MYRRLEEQVIPDKRLGRHINHDPRSLAYAYTAKVDQLASVLHKREVPIFDQGNLGSCTGNASVGVLGSDPFFATLPTGKNSLDETEAVDVYSAATQIDSYSGSYPPDDTGSDGLSVAQVLKSRGMISGYQHALSIDQALAALQTYPVITGVSWYEGFDNPDATGKVTISGSVRGGHEFEVVGIDVDARTVRAANSWGTSWGDQGYFTFSWDDWTRLLGENGDVTILLPLTVPAPTPTPTPTPPAPTPTPPTPPAPQSADQVFAGQLHDWLRHPHLFSHNLVTEARAWLRAKNL